MPSRTGADGRGVVALVAALGGVLAAVTNCAFVFRPWSASRLDPVDSFISELEVPGQPDSAFFRYASLLSGLFAVVLAVGLLARWPRGRLGTASGWALVVFGVAGAADALIPMDCAPSASAVCFRSEQSGPQSWPYQAHTWFDLLGTVALLVGLWLAGRHLRDRPGWRLTAESGRVGLGVLTGLGVLLTAMSAWYLPGAGVVQRLFVLLTSVWLVVLSVDVARHRAQAPGPRPLRAPARGRAAPAPGRPSGWPETAARVISSVVTLAAIWSVASIVVRGPAREVVQDAFGVVNLPVGASLFTVALMVVLAGALRRRLRLALWVLVLFQVLALIDGAVSVGIGATSGTRALVARFAETDRAMLAVSAASAAALIPLFLIVRDAFPARLYPASRRPAAAILLGGLAASAAIALTLTWIAPADLGTAGDRVQWALRAVVGVDAPRTDALGVVHRGHHWIVLVATTVSGLALLAAIAVFLRAARVKRFLSAQDELDLRVLLRRTGSRDSLGYFATRRDKSVVFGPHRRAAVTHRVLASVSLASGDPIGPPEHWGPAIRAWLAEAREYGWYPAVLGAGEEAARAYTAAGLRALPLGDEAILDVRTFSLRSPELRPVRRAAARVARSGYRIRIARHAELSGGELTEIGACAERWRGTEPDRGFSMALNRLGDPTDGRCLAVVATDSAGRLRGVLSFVPWGADGLSLDLMRRDDAAVNGVTEAMVAALMTECPDLGVRRVSLNFAVLRAVFDAAERVSAGPLVRTGNRALLVASRFWQLQTLYRTTARYRPRWVPRYLLFDSAFALPRAAVAAGMAEGFLPAPRTAPPEHLSEPVVWQGQDGVALAEAVAELDRLPVSGPPAGRRLSPEERARRAKLDRLTEAGMEPYPVAVSRTTTVAELRRRHAGLVPGARSGERVAVAGRVRAVRDFGNLVFADLLDGGDRLQLLLARDTVGEEPLRLWRRTVDRGDHVSVTGEVVASDTGELSVLVGAWAMAAKCLEPVPRIGARIADPETRVRKRHLDLLLDPAATDAVRARGRALKGLRDLLAARGFDEVETPVLQRVHGGAAARPFITTINAYGLPLYLRIAPELYLKRLAVGGMERVYEIGRNFRNEGVDATHHPEFTSLEAYQAYGDYETMRELARDLVLAAAVALHGEPVAHRRAPGGGVAVVDLSGPWPVVPVHEAVSKATGAVLTPDSTRDDVAAVCRQHDVRFPPGASAGEAVTALYERLVEPATQEPTFYTDFPVETSPLTRVHRRDPRLAERWDLVAFGMELGTAYSELVDPVEQRRRLTEQSLRAAAGDADAMQLDEDFLGALEYAMPPTGGLGLGVDRLLMLLTGGSIRSTLSFPFVRPERSG